MSSIRYDLDNAHATIGDLYELAGTGYAGSLDLSKALALISFDDPLRLDKLHHMLHTAYSDIYLP
jgi:hypothetical protein